MLKMLGKRRENAAAGRADGAGFVRPSPDVLTAERDGIAVLLDLRREIYLGLDEVGTMIWRGIEDGVTTAEIADRIAEEYDAPRADVLRDTGVFMDDLVARRLVLVQR